MTPNTDNPDKPQATCKTCGASGPPWHHQPSILDRDGIGDPGHRMPDKPSESATFKPQANQIQPIDGRWISQLNQYDQHSMFLLATKLNEVIQAINVLGDVSDNIKSNAKLKEK
jgi:hypothetical protein